LINCFSFNTPCDVTPAIELALQPEQHPCGSANPEIEDRK